MGCCQRSCLLRISHVTYQHFIEVSMTIAAENDRDRDEHRAMAAYGIEAQNMITGNADYSLVFALATMLTTTYSIDICHRVCADSG